MRPLLIMKFIFQKQVQFNNQNLFKKNNLEPYLISKLINSLFIIHFT
jgi:hypothetical protein